MTYMDFTCELIMQKPVGFPIYTKEIAEALAENFKLKEKSASAAAAVAVKRIMDARLVPDLRFYQRGIYYRTAETLFGERGIDKERLIADKYLHPDRGYETGPGLLHNLGLTTQMPRRREIATNAAGQCARVDKRLDVTVRPPKTEVRAGNKAYLQTLDALELLERAPIDAEDPYRIVARHIEEAGMEYGRLLALADRHYGKRVLEHLAHTASEGGLAL